MHLAGPRYRTETSKVNVSNMDTQIVADSLMDHLPISTWQYKSGTNAERDPDYQDGHGVRRGGEGGQVRHVGPMAQDVGKPLK